MEFKNELKNACDVLSKGGVILYPTDTIWGIGCDASNEKAVQRVYEIKQRVDSKSMLVLLDTSAKLDFYVSEVPDIALDLIEVADKPLTLIYPGARNLASNLIADDGSIGIRITSEMFSKELCRQFRKPLVSTSANVSGEASPANFNEINEQIIKSVDYVVDYRRDELTSSRPSSIIKVGKGNTVQIIRS